ncbi:MAG: DUF2939 domain-containing protein [Candidatus Obscuribacterales bacterium]|nr:DUF2939 domain-containing protein [Candidatus Obscuribacterales bacterium]
MTRLIEFLIYPLFFVTVVWGLAYWYWTTTPTYALSQIVAAVKNKDTESFEKYVDIESIAYRAIDDVLHGPAKESGMFGNFDSMIGVGIIGLFKPEIAEIAKTQVIKFIESGQLVNAIAEAQQTGNQSSKGSEIEANKSSKHSSSSDLSPVSQADNSMVSRYAGKLKLNTQLKAYGLSKDGFKGIDYLKTEGTNSFVGFKFHSDKFNRDIIVEIKMEEAGGYWRVTELSNLNDLINTYLETRDQLNSRLQEPKRQLFLLSKSEQPQFI